MVAATEARQVRAASAVVPSAVARVVVVARAVARVAVVRLAGWVAGTARVEGQAARWARRAVASHTGCVALAHPRLHTPSRRGM